MIPFDETLVTRALQSLYATREELHKLIDSLPEGAMEAAHRALSRLQDVRESNLSGAAPGGRVAGLECQR